jgi:hypothetical protein
VVVVRRTNERPSGRLGDPWVLRHSLVVFIAGAGGAAATFVIGYWWADGTDKAQFDVAIKAATAVAAIAAAWLFLASSRWALRTW